MPPAIVPIVEGQSEVASIPVLLRRLLHRSGLYELEVARPFRVKRDRIVRPGELEKALALAGRSRPGAAAVVVVLDADDDCPAELGPRLAERCRQTCPLPALVVVANRELEGWFLGAKESLRGIRGIRNDAAAPEDPEHIRGAKERLSSNMVAGRRYLEIDDQPAFAELVDLELAQERCPSFARFVQRLDKLASELA
jgi:hypothetical protein